jgi:hypothetical protein
MEMLRQGWQQYGVKGVVKAAPQVVTHLIKRPAKGIPGGKIR